ncbi:MAG: family 78 glycoside hydrolase catalytic domain [Clostridia bacterium]|nr:family 78 glycoside hydrolase catalytic domain [Clostridia bacterium]
MNNHRLRKTARYRITEDAPRFSWAAQATHHNAVQQAYRLQIRSEAALLWDSGWVESAQQEAFYDGAPLPAEQKLYVRVAVRDDLGDESAPLEEYFYISGLRSTPLGWIAASEDLPETAVYFRKNFVLSGEVKQAVVYACGLGYHQLFLNGERLDDAVLDPLHSDYTKSCYYTMLPEVANRLRSGQNCLCIAIGDGWRRTEEMLRRRGKNIHKSRFMGIPQLSAVLKIQYADGHTELFGADESWGWTHGAIVCNNIFNGEAYDARVSHPDWNQPDAVCEYFRPAVAVPSPGGEPRTAVLEPITEHGIYTPKCLYHPDENTCVVDFGVNISGYCRLRLPQGMKRGQTISLLHAELLDEDGRVFSKSLRTAQGTDTYIAAGDERDALYWQPSFTYHGFRYVQITGWPLLSQEDIVAIHIHSDVENDSVFTSGNALVNQIQENLVRTEKDNMMGILTDCPQRDERSAWMNDATVRFQATPYNFQVGALFPKIVRDLLDVQNPDGSITCTAPFVFGTRPADPVCSAFLVAGMEALMHTGNLPLIAQTYDAFARWEDCLSTRTEEHIVTYSHYGDWASPTASCMEEADPHSAVTPGIFMSTGYYYYNAVLLGRFAAVLGKTEDQKRYEEQAEAIKQAMLAKWWDEESGKVATGSQGCQTFALWLGIVPENKRELAAKRLHEDLVANDYGITTGNLTTKYLFEVLCDYGYVEDAWKLITREEYPSFGYMIQNEATTIWERWELRKTGRINSYNHPMYGAVGYWFYAYLAGIKPTKPGFSEVTIRPYFPQKLLSANASLKTMQGDLTVRWIKREGKTYLYVDVPFGVKATVHFGGEAHVVGSGFWVYEADEGKENGASA